MANTCRHRTAQGTATHGQAQAGNAAPLAASSGGGSTQRGQRAAVAESYHEDVVDADVVHRRERVLVGAAELAVRLADVGAVQAHGDVLREAARRRPALRLLNHERQPAAVRVRGRANRRRHR